MINLLFDITTGAVKLAQLATIKVGADVPVRVTFSADPGEVTDIQFALGTDGAAPETLAFTEDFDEENSVTWTALLDANDTRLIEFMDGKAATTVVGELVCLLNGRRQVGNNVSVTVQPRIVSGPESSEGGPTYLTEAQSDARYLQTVRWTASLVFFGEAVVDQIFDCYQTDFAAKLTAIEISAQDAPTGSGGVTIQLIDGLGVNISNAVTLVSGTSSVRTTLGAPLAIALDSKIRAKITAVGGTNAGGHLNVRLSFKP